MKKNNIEQNQIDRRKQETHTIRQLLTNRASRGGKD